MALLKFPPKGASTLPNAEDTGIGEVATKETNSVVSKVLQDVTTPRPPGPATSYKRKATVFLLNKEHLLANMLQKSAAVKKFKESFENG